METSSLKKFSVIGIKHIDFDSPEIYPVVPSFWINLTKKQCSWIDSDVTPDYLKLAVKEMKDPPNNLTTYDVRIVTSADEYTKACERSERASRKEFIVDSEMDGKRQRTPSSKYSQDFVNPLSLKRPVKRKSDDKGLVHEEPLELPSELPPATKSGLFTSKSAQSKGRSRPCVPQESVTRSVRQGDGQTSSGSTDSTTRVSEANQSNDRRESPSSCAFRESCTRPTDTFPSTLSAYRHKSQQRDGQISTASTDSTTRDPEVSQSNDHRESPLLPSSCAFKESCTRPTDTFPLVLSINRQISQQGGGRISSGSTDSTTRDLEASQFNERQKSSSCASNDLRKRPADTSPAEFSGHRYNYNGQAGEKNSSSSTDSTARSNAGQNNDRRKSSSSCSIKECHTSPQDTSQATTSGINTRDKSQRVNGQKGSGSSNSSTRSKASQHNDNPESLRPKSRKNFLNENRSQQIELPVTLPRSNSVGALSEARPNVFRKSRSKSTGSPSGSKESASSGKTAEMNGRLDRERRQIPNTQRTAKSKDREMPVDLYERPTSNTFLRGSYVNPNESRNELVRYFSSSKHVDTSLKDGQQTNKETSNHGRQKDLSVSVGSSASNRVAIPSTSVVNPVESEPERIKTSLLVEIKNFLKNLEQRIINIEKTLERLEDSKPDDPENNEDWEERFLNLPIDSVTELENLNEKLKSRKARTILNKFLVRVAGQNYLLMTNAVMKFVMTDSLASQYLFCGTTRVKGGAPKKKFRDLKRICKCVIDAVTARFNGVDKQGIERKISRFFVNAPGRIKSREKRNESSEEAGLTLGDVSDEETVESVLSEDEDGDDDVVDDDDISSLGNENGLEELTNKNFGSYGDDYDYSDFERGFNKKNGNLSQEEDSIPEMDQLFLSEDENPRPWLGVYAD